MAEKQAYAIMILLRGNKTSAIMSEDFLEALGDKKKCAFVNHGIDLSRYVGCFVFKDKQLRDDAARRIAKLGIKIHTRDDALVDERYWNMFG